MFGPAERDHLRLATALPFTMFENANAMKTGRLLPP